ncbi:TPA: glycosyl hydrolase [Raoultella planticola]|uniref:beta-glucosidase n=1 Tax=Raoultella planticola TaxID=575 RepID=UPI001A1E3A85|nr:glycosyl hydrolase [Raoultella planticola]HAT1623131.1 glycosyl hydrolase [Raoultella planticola]
MFKFTRLTLAILIGCCQYANAEDMANSRLWMNPKLNAEQRAQALVNAMTLDEKIRRVHSEMALPILGFSVPEGAIGSAGYVPADDKLGIPALQVSDASLGVTNPANVRPKDGATALPSGLSSAASWDPSLSFQNGQLIGSEAWSKGFNVLLAGGVNLARDPRNGRNFEYYGEDPLLAGILVGNNIRGIQSQHVLSTIKHFAMNDQETARQGMSADIAEDAMRESDLLAFKIAMEIGHPGAVMCGYNRVNGTYSCENAMLLQKILKDDWKYPGFVMSDWGAVHSADAALKGLDIEMGSQLDKLLYGNVWFDKPLAQAARDKLEYSARLDDMNRRILRSLFENGLFEHPPAITPVDYKNHAAKAQHAAEEGMVLLRNESSFLPLKDRPQNILVIGGNADIGVLTGAGSSQVTPPGEPPMMVHTGGEGLLNSLRDQTWFKSSPLAALKANLPQSNMTFNDGRSAGEAAALAKKADIVIVFATQWMMESYDAFDLSLPDGQDAMIEAVAKANPHTAVVLETGGAINMPWLNETKAILQAWYPGSAGGPAIANVLTGVVNPSGHLPVTFPKNLRQLPRPEIVGFGQSENASVNVNYNIEGSDVGYRWFAKHNEKVLFPFGYGLSYTRFIFKGLHVDSLNPLKLSVNVKNVGESKGKAVPQFYLQSINRNAETRLLGWDKVELAPGEERRVAVTVDPRLLAHFSTTDRGWKIAAGDYTVAVGSSSADQAETATVVLKPALFIDTAVSH